MTVTGAKGEETVDKVGTSVQKSVFEFLSAEGIHPTEVTKETEKNAILSSNSLLNNSQDMSNESAQKEDNKESSSL